MRARPKREAVRSTFSFFMMIHPFFHGGRKPHKKSVVLSIYRNAGKGKGKMREEELTAHQRQPAPRDMAVPIHSLTHWRGVTDFPPSALLLERPWRMPCPVHPDDGF